MRVLGLDLGKKRAGLVIVDSDTGYPVLRLTVGSPTDTDTTTVVEHFADTLDRVLPLADAVAFEMVRFHRDLEGDDRYRATVGSLYIHLQEGVVRDRCAKLDLLCGGVHVTNLKRFAGYGGNDKAAMRLALGQRTGWCLDGWCHDEVDAAWAALWMIDAVRRVEAPEPDEDPALTT